MDRFERIRPRHFVYLFACIVFIFVIWRLKPDVLGPSYNSTLLAILGPVFVTVGWMLTNEIAIGNSRRQHTISLIVQHAFDPKRLENRGVIKSRLVTYKTRLDNSICPDFGDERDELLVAIDIELNFYEFLAIGIRNGDLDHNMTRRALRSQFLAFHEQCAEYIAFWQKRHPSTWCELSLLYKRWAE